MARGPQRLMPNWYDKLLYSQIRLYTDGALFNNLINVEITLHNEVIYLVDPALQR